MKKKIGILGSGAVGKSLATGLLANGYEVMIGTRNQDKLADWLSQNKQGRVGSFEVSAAFGELLILATLGTAAESVLSMAGTNNLKDKTIIDATNPIDNQGPEDGVLRFFTDINYSLMERLQATFTEAHFVKGFNSVGAHLMVNPDFGGIKPTMFICGNNEQAKSETSEICRMFGWEVEDMGSAKAARAIEPLCMLWCIPGFKDNQWQQAFKFLKK